MTLRCDSPEFAPMLERIRRFVREECIPVEEAIDRDDRIPETLVERMRELGLFGPSIPREYGGGGLDTEALARVNIEVSQAAAVFRARFGGNTGIGSTFSFYFGHHMTTIEGGMVCVQDEKLYNLLRAKRSHGLSREMLPAYRSEIQDKYPDVDPTFLFPTKGYNFRNVETGAVLGRVQLKKLDSWNEQRSKNYAFFRKEMLHRSWFENLPKPTGNSAMTLPFHCKDAETAAEVKKFLQLIGIETRPFLVGNLLRQPFMEDYESLIPLPNSERMHTHSFYIGNNHFIKEGDIKALSKVLDRCGY